MGEKFNYTVDTVTTQEYYLAINKLTKVAFWTPSEPFSRIDFEIGVQGLAPEFRKIILSAGRLTSMNEDKESHYYFQKIGFSEVILEAFKGPSDIRWIRLCIYHDPHETNVKKRTKSDFYLLDTNDTDFKTLCNIQLMEWINGQSQVTRPVVGIKTDEGQGRAKRFIASWQEGLRNLLGLIPNPIDDLEMPLEIDF